MTKTRHDVSRGELLVGIIFNGHSRVPSQSYTAAVNIHALYYSSYLRSKTTMSTGEWSCLISFTWALLTNSERRGSEKLKKI